MKCATLIREDNFYYRDKTDSFELGLLRSFLTDDVGPNTPPWFLWSEHPAVKETESNASWVQKKDNTIIIGDLTDKRRGLSPEESLVIRITAENFQGLLKKWAEVVKHAPGKVTITEKNGVYDLHFET